MKKIFAVISILLCTTLIWADNNKSNQIKQQKARVFGITVGYTQTSMYETYPLLNSYTTSKDQYNRFHAMRAGVSFNPEFGAGIGLLAAIQYVYTPTHSRLGTPAMYDRTAISQHELAIPLRLQYRYEFTPGFSVFAYTGPSFNTGLAWNMKIESFSNGEKTSSTTTNFYDDVNNYSRFHCMWGVGAGVIFNRHLRAEIFCDWGLNNVRPYSGSFTHLNQPFNIAISYML